MISTLLLYAIKSVYLSQAQSFFLIKFWTSYLGCDCDKKEVKLDYITVKSLVPENLLWQLHTQPDGTFTMETYNQILLQCDKENKLVFISDGYKFWRREGNFIVSERSHDYLGADHHGDICVSLHSNHCDGTDDAQKYKCECAVEKVVRYFTDVPSPQS